jgi:porin
MSARTRRKLWLVAAAVPLSIGSFSSRAARAQSVPPLRQSLPPRPFSLPPPKNARRSAGAGGDAAASVALVASPAIEERADAAAPAPPVPTATDAKGVTEAGPAGAAPPAPPVAEPKPGWLDGKYLTTDWGGARTWMLEHGLDLQLSYTAESYGRLTGGTGTKRPVTYLGTAVAALDVDTGALGAWKGGSLRIMGETLHGKGITNDHLGTLQVVSNLDADTYTSVAEYWYRQELFDGKLGFKIGRQDGSVDFAATDFGSTLLCVSFGAFPTLPLPNYPNWALGAEIFSHPTDWLSLEAAVFDGASDGRKPLGGTTFFDGSGGHFVIGQAELHLAPLLRAVEGTLRLGAWYHTGDTPALPTSAHDPGGKTFTHNYGAYATLDEKLYRPRGEGRESEGLGLFLQLGFAPEDRNDARMYFGGGFAYTGAIPGRPDDVASVGFGHADFARPLRDVEGRTAETVFEATYRAQLMGAVSLQPDLQWYVNPAGRSGAANATVIGLRLVANL